jgi:23S rRNA pseudouridine1911/1915/1917 synthase
LLRLTVTTRFGRRHQVRAHLAHVGLPIRGDRLYGDRSEWTGRLALHAVAVRLPDGREIVAPLPADLSALEEAVR